MNITDTLDKRYKTKNRKPLKNMMELKNFDKIRVKGDGSCLYRAIAQSLNKSFSNNYLLDKKEELIWSKKLRKIALEEICKKNGSTKPVKGFNITYKQSILSELKSKRVSAHKNIFSKYCSCQKGNKKTNECRPCSIFLWGGFNEINAISKMLNINIYVYVKNKDGTFDKVSIKQKNNKKIIYLILNNNHYSSLFHKNH
tara:strand:+ start:164 stop:760 length:597 start_codon:yes stop_codon:yes gene_type:complete